MEKKEMENLSYLQAFSMKPSIFTTRTFQYTVQWKMFNQIQAYRTLWRPSRFFIRKDLNWFMLPTVRSTNNNVRFPYENNVLRTFLTKNEDSKMKFLWYLWLNTLKQAKRGRSKQIMYLTGQFNRTIVRKKHIADWYSVNYGANISPFLSIFLLVQITFPVIRTSVSSYISMLPWH